nr:DNA gyrase C-terminal beta-propeller domain-containing protein [Enterococcus ureasiticus]
MKFSGFNVDSVSQTGRATLGVRLMRMEEDAKVVTMAVVEPEPDEIVEEVEGVETTVVETETIETDTTTEE